VLSALYRWLVEQRYVLANPFAGLKVRGADREGALDAGRSFTEGEWSVIRVVADGLEHSYGWSKPAAQRLRFLIDFSYGTGLRASELVGARLGRIEVDAFDDHWLRLRGKGGKAGKVALPPLVRGALDQYLVQRRLPTIPSKWDPNKPIIGRIDAEDPGAITSSRLWSVVRRFFRTVADVIAETNPALAAKLRTATTHWMRHTPATHALQRGVELTTVRDNLRHASISTTSTYLHGDDTKRARQIGGAFGRPV
jgi:site-specific recombinase XerD